MPDALLINNSITRWYGAAMKGWVRVAAKALLIQTNTIPNETMNANLRKFVKSRPQSHQLNVADLSAVNIGQTINTAKKMEPAAASPAHADCDNDGGGDAEVQAPTVLAVSAGKSRKRKRSLSGWNMFASKMRTMNMTNVSAAWKALSDADRQSYDDASVSANERIEHGVPALPPRTRELKKLCTDRAAVVAVRNLERDGEDAAVNRILQESAAVGRNVKDTVAIVRRLKRSAHQSENQKRV